MTPGTDASSPAAPPRKKPHLSFLLATWFGLGCLPKAPGTWGSVGSFPLLMVAFIVTWFIHDNSLNFDVDWKVAIILWFLTAIIGVRCSSQVAAYLNKKDPQQVVIDEVSGQFLTLLLGVPVASLSWISSTTYLPLYFWGFHFRWPALLAGFILFRLFDIWKPFPIRKLEKLPGGWGIMADDWLAGIYAAILLRLALHFNLL
jgi:phosphatidylglycerophosphatase A